VERIHNSLEDRLVFSFKKDNFKGIGNALCVAYPFFIILPRRLREYQRRG